MKSISLKRENIRNRLPAHSIEKRGWVLPNVGVQDFEKFVDSSYFNKNEACYSIVNKILLDSESDENVF